MRPFEVSGGGGGDVTREKAALEGLHTQALRSGAQFRAAVSERMGPRYIGTALTVQTSLGFMLTLLTTRLIPPLVEAVGWQYVLMFPALGQAFGAWSMLQLRRLPEAVHPASGHR